MSFCLRVTLLAMGILGWIWEPGLQAMPRRQGQDAAAVCPACRGARKLSDSFLSAFRRAGSPQEVVEDPACPFCVEGKSRPVAASISVEELKTTATGAVVKGLSFAKDSAQVFTLSGKICGRTPGAAVHFLEFTPEGDRISVITALLGPATGSKEVKVGEEVVVLCLARGYSCEDGPGDVKIIQVGGWLLRTESGDAKPAAAPAVRPLPPPPIERPKPPVLVKTCTDQLHDLWTMQMNYSISFGGRLKRMPQATGPEFWLALARTNPPLIGPSNLDLLVCPAKGETPREGFTSYRGPPRNVAELKAEDPVGACRHADGSVNVLYKSRDVRSFGVDDPAGKAAIEATRGPGDR